MFFMVEENVMTASPKINKSVAANMKLQAMNYNKWQTEFEPKPDVLRLLDVTYRIPLGIHLLFLKLGKLSAVVDDHEQLPDEQQGQTDHYNSCDHTSHDGDDVRSWWALWHRERKPSKACCCCSHASLKTKIPPFLTKMFSPMFSITYWPN